MILQNSEKYSGVATCYFHPEVTLNISYKK